jgi:hypothetical protein
MISHVQYRMYDITYTIPQMQYHISFYLCKSFIGEIHFS